MNRFLVCTLTSIIISGCQSLETKSRLPAAADGAEFKLDSKFEEFEEGTLEKEIETHKKIISFGKQLMTRMQSTSSQPAKMARDAHAKSHGCLKANFIVSNDNLPKPLRVGVFSENKSYSAWVRFSNNDHMPVRKDNELDLRGMAIKVMNVQGRKILSGLEDEPTQDFLMYGSPIFFVKNNSDYVNFMKALRDDRAAQQLITEQPIAALKTAKAQIMIRNYINPLNMPYHSAVPIRIGLENDPERVAAKYRTIPCYGPYASPVDKRNLNYLRENMKSTLGTHNACFYLQVQVQTDPLTMPVEDSTFLWPEKDGRLFTKKFSSYLTVARVVIPKQNFDNTARDSYCEDLSFTPWHALVEHKPLGRTMRMRRDVYRATSEFRRSINKSYHREPSGFEID